MWKIGAYNGLEKKENHEKCSEITGEEMVFNVVGLVLRRWDGYI